MILDNDTGDKKMKEVEILVQLHSSKEEADRAILPVAKYQKTVKTLDQYYYDPLRSDLAPDKQLHLSACLRVRTRGEESSITYKIDHFDVDGSWTYSDEHETKLEKAEEITKILSLLGMRELVTVDMEKKYYHNNLYNIAIEDVKDLGCFLEVEAKQIPDDADPMETKSSIEQFIKDLGLDISRNHDGGKPEMLLQKRMACQPTN